MADETSFWDKLSDAMPWNRQKVADRKTFEREMQAMADDDVAPAGSAAEAMQAMKAASKAKRKPAAPDAEPEEPVGRSVPESGRQSASEAEKDRIRRNRGG